MVSHCKYVRTRAVPACIVKLRSVIGPQERHTIPIRAWLRACRRKQKSFFFWRAAANAWSGTAWEPAAPFEANQIGSESMRRRIELYVKRGSAWEDDRPGCSGKATESVRNSDGARVNAHLIFIGIANNSNHHILSAP